MCTGLSCVSSQSTHGLCEHAHTAHAAGRQDHRIVRYTSIHTHTHTHTHVCYTHTMHTHTSYTNAHTTHTHAHLSFTHTPHTFSHTHIAFRHMHACTPHTPDYRYGGHHCTVHVQYTLNAVLRCPTVANLQKVMEEVKLTVATQQGQPSASTPPLQPTPLLTEPGVG